MARARSLIRRIGSSVRGQSHPSQHGSAPPPPSQLQMRKFLSGSGEEPTCPDPYRFCHAGVEASRSWLELLNASGEFGKITAAEFKRSVIRNLIPSGAALLEHRGEIVAAAATCVVPADAPSATLMYVVVSPPHRGLGLGAVVAARAVAAGYAIACPTVVLRTDDDRLAAIRTYLKLGFTPVPDIHASHHDRWARVLRRLASTDECR